MKILILQLYTTNIKDIADVSKENVQSYCKKYGYDYKCYDHTLDADRHPAWSKILAILDCLDNTDYDWIWWIDADAFIVNDKIELTDIISKHSEYDIIFTDQKYRCNVNSGSILVKRSEFSRKFFDEVYHNKNVDPFKKACCWEQDSINDLLFGSLNVLKTNPRPIKSEFCDHVTIVNNNLFNSVFSPYCSCDHLRTYKDGDFVIHFAGTKNIQQINDKLRDIKTAKK